MRGTQVLYWLRPPLTHNTHLITWQVTQQGRGESKLHPVTDTINNYESIWINTFIHISPTKPFNHSTTTPYCNHNHQIFTLPKYPFPKRIVHLARLRCVHHSTLQAYRNRLDATIADTCPECTLAATPFNTLLKTALHTTTFANNTTYTPRGQYGKFRFRQYPSWGVWSCSDRQLEELQQRRNCKKDTKRCVDSTVQGPNILNDRFI